MKSSLLIPLTLLMAGCASRSTTSGIPQLQVAMDDPAPSYKVYFDRIELLPLENTDSALMARVDKIECVNDTLIAYDGRQYRIKVFDSKGKFLTNIGNIGQGPGEYTFIYDISYNPQKQILSLLSPFGEYLNFTLDDKFVNRVQLPAKSNYQSFTWVNATNLALWSAVEKDEAGIQIINTDTGETVYEDWYNERLTDFQQGYPFYTYNDDLFFAKPIGRCVYKLDKDSLVRAYEWDLGKDNFDIEGYINEIGETDVTQKSKKIREDLASQTLPYLINENWQNDGYYAARVFSMSDNKATYRTLLYDKAAKTGSCISQFKEGMSIYPVYMNNEFIISPIPAEEVEIYNRICNQNIPTDEDQNVVLAKYYFKKR
ncbi:MAG: 6-bladed beta-propeller [Muribaculaceae bacterium]|nr:6-bladed beta-propeller [Muribaculaceae bacterium]